MDAVTAREINSKLPLRIGKVFLQYPVISVSGAGWGLSFLCEWEGEVFGQPVTDEFEGQEAVLERLHGQALVAYAQINGTDRFTFSNGWISATPETNLDPWSLTIRPDLFVIGEMAPCGSPPTSAPDSEVRPPHE